MRSGIAAACLRGQLMETVCIAATNRSPRESNPVSTSRLESRPEIPKCAAETGPRNVAKKRLNASSARKRDRMPPPNPRKCRTFPRERRHSRKNRYAWLGFLNTVRTERFDQVSRDRTGFQSRTHSIASLSLRMSWRSCRRCMPSDPVRPVSLYVMFR